jgi:sulfofructosephosphate aldolase
VTPGLVEQRLAGLARATGAYAMVALDQRESLRQMFEKARGTSVGDDVLVDFKRAAAELLAPHASAVLLDAQFGLPAFDAIARVPSCGRILAADLIIAPPGDPSADTAIDESIVPAEVAARGASALKLLVIWRGEENRDACIDKVSRFIASCHEADLPAVVEPITRPPKSGGAWDREAALVEAARTLGALGPDLYKSEVPFQGKGDGGAIVEVAEAITAALHCPWVVLSQGVSIPDYPRAVELSCQGGASGFLAGRAVWSDALETEDYRTAIADRSVARLQGLIDIIDRVVSARSATVPIVS